MIPKNDYVFYTQLPHNPQTETQTLVLLPYHRPPRRLNLGRCIISAAAALLLAAAAFVLFPSDPTLKLTHLRLNTVRVNSSPKLTLDLSFSLTLRVLNRDFFSLDYHSLVVSVGYRGRELGVFSSSGGRIRARGSSDVEANLVVDGFEVIHDAFFLIQDLARGVIPFDSDSQIHGELGFFLFKIPLKAKVSCQVYVNTNNQTIVHQDCYPD